MPPPHAPSTASPAFPPAAAFVCAGVVGVLAIITPAAPARAEPLPGELPAARVGTVAAVHDATTLELGDGRRFRLAAIDVPAPRGGAGARALAADARRVVEEMALGRALSAPDGIVDRYGRVVAHGAVDGRWLQAELVARGLARVRTDPDFRAGARRLLEIESAARQAGLGLWSLDAYRVLRAADAGRAIDTFALVEGTVVAHTRRSGRVWLNFGPDWRTDFTVLIAPAALRLCRRAGLDPEKLQGQTVRIRGWILLQNGPLIELSHPEQIEVLTR